MIRLQVLHEETDKGISPWTKSPFLESVQPEALLHAVFFLESLDAPRSVDNLLLPGKEGMTGRADLGSNLGFSGTGLERMAAQALDRNLDILGMDSLFHCFLLAKSTLPSLLSESSEG
jgi:hypothetical protein